MRQYILDVITSEAFLYVWVPAMALSVGVLIYDLFYRNQHLAPLMKAVWILTVVYSGALGLAIYFATGRKEIPKDNLWRRAARSTAHCYSGCGAGEVAGVVLTVGLLSLANLYVALTTFAFAYATGFLMTLGPLMQSGVSFKTAFKDTAISETASIAVMEIVAIGVDLWLARDATLGEAVFWASLVFSLSVGFLAAYPVNVLLIKLGVKEGMHNPKKTG